jgi:hypothetical protein
MGDAIRVIQRGRQTDNGMNRDPVGVRSGGGNDTRTAIGIPILYAALSMPASAVLSSAQRPQRINHRSCLSAIEHRVTYRCMSR